MRRPTVRRTDPRLQTIRETIERLVPGAVPANVTVTVTVTETLPGTVGHDGEPHKHTWQGCPDALAEKLHTALYGRPRTQGEQSPQTRRDSQGPRLTVKLTSARYAEELRRAPGKASADGQAGWACGAGASLIARAQTPGPGRLGTHHGVIYVCTEHQAAAEERIAGAGYEPQVDPAPAGHRWDPWPCGHVTAYTPAALAALSEHTGPDERAVMTARDLAANASDEAPMDTADLDYDDEGEQVAADPKDAEE